MKKLLLPVGLLIFFFSFSLSASATSGACSDHGGVDCSAGIGSLGANAICNDGYESSTSYYDTGECVGNFSSCSQPIKSYCSDASDYAKHCGTPSQYTSDMYEACHADCENQINQYNSEVQTYDSCLSQQPQQDIVPNQSVQQIEQQSQNEITADNLQLQQEEDQLQQETCISSYGSHATASGSSCVCQAGYQLDSSDSQCETPTMFCNNTLGSNSQPVLVQQNGTKSYSCVCADGYSQDSSGTCTPISIPDSPQPSIEQTSDVKGYQGLSEPPPSSAFAGANISIVATNPVATSTPSSTTLGATSSESSSTVATTSPSSQPKNTGFIYRIYEFIRSFF